MSPQMLELLLAGEYLCPVRYPDEFNALDSSDDLCGRVSDWLGHMDRRLARVGEDGAFFMAPAKFTDKVTSRIRAELRDFRDTYGPAVRMLDFIRQTNPENVMCSLGERIQLVDLESAVNGSTTLGSQLRNLLDVIHGGNARISDRENLHRLMEHLCKDGYVILLDRSTDTYQITGKVEQLYAALSFLDDHKVIEEQDIDDQLELADEAARVEDENEEGSIT
jgi:hypothetical protein